jgi:hypothetical protein
MTRTPNLTRNEGPLPARFRYRISDGKASFGVVLEQPALVAKAAWQVEVDKIDAHGDYRLMVGRPAAAE